jgi:multidrug efflux pump subunit AcrA (membrane-fusion protein)
VGQAVEIDGGEAQEAGKLIFIGSEVDPRSDTVVVRVSLPANTEQKPGQFLAIRIICEEHKNCLAIAETGLVRDEEDKSAIMLVEGEIDFFRLAPFSLTFFPQKFTNLQALSQFLLMN